ncbi:MAG: hypothetical protein K6B41_02390 [Butyrivibrio sp.]|nr:hypothetical protein [Butyrivibrio sp.]
MFTFLMMLFFIWVLGGFIKFAFRATWGLFKILGVFIMIFAFPMVFLVILAGIGSSILLPIILIALAFGCIAKAA